MKTLVKTVANVSAQNNGIEEGTTKGNTMKTLKKTSSIKTGKKIMKLVDVKYGLSTATLFNYTPQVINGLQKECIEHCSERPVSTTQITRYINQNPAYYYMAKEKGNDELVAYLNSVEQKLVQQGIKNGLRKRNGVHIVVNQDNQLVYGIESLAWIFGQFYPLDMDVEIQVSVINADSKEVPSRACSIYKNKYGNSLSGKSVINMFFSLFDSLETYCASDDFTTITDCRLIKKEHTTSISFEESMSEVMKYIAIDETTAKEIYSDIKSVSDDMKESPMAELFYNRCLPSEDSEIGIKLTSLLHKLDSMNLTLK